MVLFRKHKEHKLEAERHVHDVAELRQKLSEVTDADGVISVDGFREFVDFVGDREIDPDVAKGVRIGLAEGGLFLPSNETGPASTSS